jgi:hypothetical protein
VPALVAESSELSELEPHPAKRVVVIATQSNALNNFFFIRFFLLKKFCYIATNLVRQIPG